MAVMLVLFLFSAQPSDNLPDFESLDRLVKKAGHALGFALLALTYWRALGFPRERRWVAWLLVMIFAATDEWHQSFVPGRHPSAWDVLIFDNLGALLALWVAGALRKQKRPDRIQALEARR
jgi:VanZ family protein